MNGVIEALHIFDEHNSPILSHTYTSRPLSPSYLLPLYLEHPAPRPNLIYLPNTNPPTLVFSLKHANLLFLLTTSSEVEPLLVLEFLHRIVDSFEEFLGTPLLAHKIESNYDVVAQLLTEMCDAGTINTTEPNALRDLVEVEGFMGKLLGNLNLPTKPTFSNPSPASLLAQQSTLALPWRRNNVRHTQNELYADVIETLSVTLAPSGRPLAAFANGTIAFTSKVSGVPDIIVTLTGPTGKHNLGSIIDLPVFHPCVRLAKWREQPGVLSFIPPDGRFTLAGYEVDLLPLGARNLGNMSASANNLKLPVSLEIKTCLGPTGSDFEVRLTVNRIPGTSGGGGGGSGSSSNYPLSSASGVGRGMGGGPQPGTPASPTLQDLKVTVPLPADVRNLAEIRTAKGDATYNPGDRFLEWTIPNKDVAAGFASHFALRCTVVGQSISGEYEDDNDDPTGFGFNTSSAGGRDWSYDAGEPAPYQSASDLLSGGDKKLTAEQEKEEKERRDGKLAQQNKILMPSSASVSFAVKGWTASGIKVESIMLDPRRSKGLAETVRPFKGVKYLTVSKGGVEIRC
ncbi:adaptor protein complex 3 Mu3A [Neurospora crassa OR74A]|uniref:Adaptor protein complex 3 Mu3A n=1 Tax=Neurospora crassa (strain ATCC 24698 / 74-OR23-1A / CBS 708.71 / DSM 1257 / FGSC 987) TaxID=367110 RepID=Q7RZK0_NEUCR|nr:adaptor protein complex 3 Mu3A [Neurospora crassa OR74A]EAA28377.2 adaptor protein complex 3 Mu3A [Neurospora crassa OR74A]|eukprot:XP_957613.2 adaptor protein complex 3 Mu3A [Neurospora crassa OR74A]